MDHASQVAAVLGGANVLVLSGLSSGVVRVDLSAEGYEAASAWVAVRDGKPAAEDVRRAVDALFEGRSVDFAGPHPIARASWQAELAPDVDGRGGGGSASGSETRARRRAAAPQPAHRGLVALRRGRGQHWGERRASCLARRAWRSVRRHACQPERGAAVERRCASECGRPPRLAERRRAPRCRSCCRTTSERRGGAGRSARWASGSPAMRSTKASR